MRFRPDRVSVSHIIVVLSAIIAFAIACPFPLTGTLGSEAALLLCVFTGPFLLIAGSITGAKRSIRGFSEDVFIEGRLALLVFLAFCGAIYLNQFHVESCATDRGPFAMLILALPVMLLNSMTGLWIGRVIGRRFFAIIAAILLLFGYIALQCVLFWQEPTLRILTHFSILLSNDIQAGQGILPSVIAYRIATFLFALTLALLGIAVFRNTQRKGLVSLPKASKALLFASGTCLLAAIAIHFSALSDISPSKADRKQQLSYVLRQEGIVVHTDPLLIDKNKAESVLAEGVFWSKRLQNRLGITAKGDIHIWLYPDRETLSYYTGAQNVHFALPSHREVHIDGTALPHPTLGHELAHVLIGQQTTTLLSVPGIAGIIPSMGLTEGLAMAITPELDIYQDLTLQEQAAAMYRVGFKPNLENLFSLAPWNFWSESMARSYVMSGALLAELLRERANTSPENAQRTFAQLAHDGELESVFTSRADLQAFLKRFETTLKDMPLPPDALHSAQQRFSPPSVLNATCNRKTQKLQQTFLALIHQGEFTKAKNALQGSGQTLAGEHYVALAQGAQTFSNYESAAWYMKRAAQSKELNARTRTEYLDKMADYMWLSGNKMGARSTWLSLDPTVFPPSGARSLIAKNVFAETALCSCDAAPLGEAAIAVLLGDAPKSGRLSRYSKLATQLSSYMGSNKTPVDLSSALALYISARADVYDGNIAVGGNKLRDVVQSGVSLPGSFLQESKRMLAKIDWQLGKKIASSEAFLLLQENSTRPSEQLLFADQIERSQFDTNAKNWTEGF